MDHSLPCLDRLSSFSLAMKNFQLSAVRLAFHMRKTLNSTWKCFGSLPTRNGHLESWITSMRPFSVWTEGYPSNSPLVLMLVVPQKHQSRAGKMVSWPSWEISKVKVQTQTFPSTLTLLLPLSIAPLSQPWTHLLSTPTPLPLLSIVTEFVPMHDIPYIFLSSDRTPYFSIDEFLASSDQHPDLSTFVPDSSFR